MYSQEPLVLTERMSIVQASALRGTFCGRLSGGGSIVLDGAQVEEIDAAILQLLVSLWRTAAEKGVTCTWSGASAPLRRAARIIGVAEALHLPPP